MIAHRSTHRAKPAGARVAACAATRTIAAVLIALAAIGIAAPAAPQTAPQPSAAAFLLARQIVDVKNVEAIFQPMVRGVVERTRESFLQANFIWAKDIDEIAADVHKQYDPRASELVDASARIYASHFSEQELKDLLAFYRSPLGQKLLAEEPKVLDESMVYAGTWADGLAAEVLATMRSDMKKRGHNL